jgi:hypothetical protein
MTTKIDLYEQAIASVTEAVRRLGLHHNPFDGITATSSFEEVSKAARAVNGAVGGWSRPGAAADGLATAAGLREMKSPTWGKVAEEVISLAG